MCTKMSAAYTNPTSGKIDQQRKILEELERQKKLLKQGQSSGPSGGGVNELGPGVGGGPPLAGRPANSGTAEMHLLSANQRAALDMASKTSFGFFITQDSSFGNLILPVIPRISP